MDYVYLDALSYSLNEVCRSDTNTTKGSFIREHKIKKVIFNGPATIIIWDDDSKTIVKCANGESFDSEKGLAMAICKKYLGKSFHKEFKKWITEEKTKDDMEIYADNVKIIIKKENK